MKVFNQAGNVGLLTLGCTLFLSTLGIGKASALQLELTAPGSSGSVNGAIFEQISDGVPAGTGNIDSFLRLQSRGNRTTEQGYNTDARPLQFDENNSPQFTRSLLLNAIPIVNINGKDYRQFILDINEPNATNRNPKLPTITLDRLQVFLSKSPALTGYPNFGGNATKVFDLDAGSNNTVLLNDLNSGSGRYDYLISIENSLFTRSKPYVYLYSKFTGAEGGFEEFAVREPQKQPATSVPEPATLAGIGLVAGAMVISRRRKAIQPIN